MVEVWTHRSTTIPAHLLTQFDAPYLSLREDLFDSTRKVTAAAADIEGDSRLANKMKEIHGATVRRV